MDDSMAISARYKEILPTLGCVPATRQALEPLENVNSLVIFHQNTGQEAPETLIQSRLEKALALVSSSSKVQLLPIIKDDSQHAINRFPSNPHIRLLLGRTLLRLGHTQKANLVLAPIPETLQTLLSDHKTPQEQRAEYNICLIRTEQLQKVISQVRHSPTDPCNLPKEIFQMVLEHLSFDEVWASRQVSFSWKTAIEGTPSTWRDLNVVEGRFGPVAPASILRFLELSNGRTREFDNIVLEPWDDLVEDPEELTKMRILQNLPRLEKLYLGSIHTPRVMSFILNPSILVEIHVVTWDYEDLSKLSQVLSHGFENLRTLSLILGDEHDSRVFPWPTAGSLPALRNLCLEGDEFDLETSLNTIDAADIYQASSNIEVLSMKRIGDYAARSDTLHLPVPAARPSFSQFDTLRAIKLVPWSWHAFVSLPESLQEFTFCAVKGKGRVLEDSEVGQIPFLPGLRLLEINSNITTESYNVWVELLRRSNSQLLELRISDCCLVDEWDAEEEDESDSQIWVQGLLFKLLQHNLLRSLQKLMFGNSHGDSAQQDELFGLIMEKCPGLTTLTWGHPCHVSQELVDFWLSKRASWIFIRGDTDVAYHAGEGIKLKKNVDL